MPELSESSDCVDIPALIEALKREIAFKAKWAAIPFDFEDIEHHEVYDGHWLVALMWIKTPQIEVDDKGHVTTLYGTKTANIWATPPPPDFVKFLPTDDPWVYEIACLVPNLHILRPELVYLIFPDGTYKYGGDEFVSWFDAEAKSQAKEDMEWAVSKWGNHV